MNIGIGSSGGSSGGTLRGQHERTVDMLSEMKEERKLSEILWFLYDCQTELVDLKTLAQIAESRKL